MVDYWPMVIFQSLAMVFLLVAYGKPRYMCRLHRRAFWTWLISGYLVAPTLPDTIHQICVAVALIALFIFLFIPCDWRRKLQRRFTETRLRVRNYMVHGIAAKRPLPV